MVDVTPLIPQGRQVIEGYGPGLFRVSGKVYQSPILVFPARTKSWAVSDLGSVTAESLEPVIAASDEVDLLLLGTGPTMQPPPQGLRATLKAVGIALEPMDSGAACRTYNVLMAESRRVAAALLLVP